MISSRLLGPSLEESLARWALHASTSWVVARPRRRIVRSRNESLSADRPRESREPMPTPLPPVPGVIPGRAVLLAPTDRRVEAPGPERADRGDEGAGLEGAA